jgi:hypothetical protein
MVILRRFDSDAEGKFLSGKKIKVFPDGYDLQVRKLLLEITQKIVRVVIRRVIDNYHFIFRVLLFKDQREVLFQVAAFVVGADHDRNRDGAGWSVLNRITLFEGGQPIENEPVIYQLKDGG